MIISNNLLGCFCFCFCEAEAEAEAEATVGRSRYYSRFGSLELSTLLNIAWLNGGKRSFASATDLFSNRSAVRSFSTSSYLNAVKSYNRPVTSLNLHMSGEQATSLIFVMEGLMDALCNTTGLDYE